ncbi:MAG: dockerin type I repeat-containing protein [Ruminococcus sp.]|nr:dockerin type I repeat-containing protein [Ruminococcus sp.]
MKHSKKTLSAVLAAAMTISMGSLFPMSASAAAYNWDNRPDWTPTDFNSAMEFLNHHGTTYAEDGMICIVKHVPNGKHMDAKIEAVGNEGDQRTDSQYESKIFSFGFEVPDETPPENGEKTALQDYMEFHGYTDGSFVDYHYEALMIKENQDSKFNIMTGIVGEDEDLDESKAAVYTFDGDTETDIWGWLPDSYVEYRIFIDMYGNLSKHDGKLVYCHDVNYSTGATLKVDQQGEGKLKCTVDSSTYNEMVMLRAGDTSHLVQVYEGEEEGDVTVSFDSNISWAPAETKDPVLTADLHVNADLTIRDKIYDVPEWIPQDSESLINFYNKHGKIWIQDGLICTIRPVTDYRSERYSYSFGGSAADKIKQYTIFSKSIKPFEEYSSILYDVNVYDIPEGTDLTINYDLTYAERTSLNSFVFEKDATGYITQKDIDAWLPDCVEEFDAYYKKNGAFSIQDGYIMYCTECPIGTGYDLNVKQSGTGGVAEFHQETITPVENTVLDGGSNFVIKLFKPEKEGIVRLDLYKARFDTDVLPENGVDTAYFRIDKDMKIYEAEPTDMKTTVKGDCNGDGIIGLSDAVAMQNWLHGKGGISENGIADINGDGVIDVFDLIALKKQIISSMSEAPKPVMVRISQNFAWFPHQVAEIYDQYGTVYVHSYSSNTEHSWDEIQEKTVNMRNDNWYKVIRSIMDTAVEDSEDQVKPQPEFCVKRRFTNDRLISDFAAFSKNTEKYSKTNMFTVNYACDMGSTTIYSIGETADGKPVCAGLATFGDSVGYINDTEVKVFIQKLVDNHMISADIFNVVNQ